MTNNPNTTNVTSIASERMGHDEVFNLATKLEEDAYLVHDYAHLMGQLLSIRGVSIEGTHAGLERLAHELVAAGRRLIEHDNALYQLGREARQ